ncbi:ADAMTS-like protein 3, partial [Pipistrellus kuhlii]|uniref:ADAMTS-like protein 3 n=1 Tax=Pipistrellus kuhlii TaxID=59472 RepID=UPI001E273F10
RYKTCSNHDCPPDAEDFRAQQCSAYNDVPYQGRHYEWLPRSDDAAAPCALRCRARGQALVAELAPKVLDGTRCRRGALDMCISGACQAVGCDRQLGSRAKEDNCGVCGGNGSTCRLVRGQTKLHVSPEKREETAIAVPLGSRSVRITGKGPAHLFIESRTLQGSRGEHSFTRPGVFVVENTTVEVQGGPGRQAFRIPGPLAADFIFKARFTEAGDSAAQFLFYQPISHQWRQTDFFPCTVTCGGGYQLNSAECVDTRLRRVVPDHYCHYYPENVKPKPKLKECGMGPCPASDGFKEIRPYDHFQPLPRWEHNPWTACSASCGGGTQRRSSVCVEESLHGEILQVEEWKCMYAPRPQVMQACNLFHCPAWVAMAWSQCTVTCGRGLRYRVVLCINHQGQHVGGCNPQLKLHIKEECLVPVPCYKPRERSPVEAKLPWLKQARELGEPRGPTDQPMFVPEPWSPCSALCGPGVQVREVRCRVLLSFAGTETELPPGECEGPPPPARRPCLLRACAPGAPAAPAPGTALPTFHWEYAGFTPCTATCLGGHQEAIAVCLHSQTRQTVNDSLCDSVHRPPAMSQACNTEPCPPRWRTGPWGPCSATCGVGIQTRDVHCLHPGDAPAPAEACGADRPHALQACNQFDCPPGWHIEDWQQCPRTCGGGAQHRRVTCRQLLTDGSSLGLSDALCQGPRPASRKSCARTDCPPHLSVGDWSECSVSCGAGTQRRKQVCQRLTAKGRRVPVSAALCRELLPAPPLVQPCQMPACSKRRGETKGPQILAARRVYIQTREEKRVHLTVGGRAYLLPNASAAASVVIRCPVRRFPKARVRWEKDGRRLQPSSQRRRWAVTKAGSLKIHGLAAPEDAGVYSCVAGPARETLVLKFIGAGNRLLRGPGPGERAATHEHERAASTQVSQASQERAAAASTQERAASTQERAASTQERAASTQERAASQAQERAASQAQERAASQAQERAASQAQERAASQAQERAASQAQERAASQAQERAASTHERAATSQERAWGPPAAATAGPGRSPDPLGSTRQTLRRVWKKQRHELLEAGGAEGGPGRHPQPLLCALLGRCHHPGAWGERTGQPSEAAEKRGAYSLDTAPRFDDDELIGNLSRLVGGPLASPVIAHRLEAELAKAQPPEEEEEEEEAQGRGDPPAGRAPQSPGGTDASRPALKSTKKGPELVQATVGSAVYITNRTAAVRLRCGLGGGGKGAVAYVWTKDGRPLQPSEKIVLSGGGVLQIRNPTRRDQGLYGCSVASPLGSDAGSTHTYPVLFAEAPVILVAGSNVSWRDPGPLSVVVGGTVRALLGTNVTIQCPVRGAPRPAASWEKRGGPLGGSASVLPDGSLWLRSVSRQDRGTYVCRAASALGKAAAASVLHLLEPAWRLGNWTPCRAACGRPGTRVRRLRCVAGGQDVSAALCRHLPRPPARPQPCPRRDCPPRWFASPWSECSASCGAGSRVRRVTCQRPREAEAGGAAGELPPGACDPDDRPPGRSPCSGRPCTAELAGQCPRRCLGGPVRTQPRPGLCPHNSSDPRCEDRRPASGRNCSAAVAGAAGACAACWRPGPWRPCSAACGPGVQARRVDCVHASSCAPLAEGHCPQSRRPASWRPCAGPSCDPAHPSQEPAQTPLATARV